ncbi:MAG: hypothetical protein GQ564_22470 [Bacteroidales bacterium]|nr:hypothetical protein [Bacteroidales bacterium]
MRNVKYLFFTIYFLLIVNQMKAQEYICGKTQADQIIIKDLIGGIRIEGSEESELIIKVVNFDESTSIKALDYKRKKNNTNIGLQVVIKNDIIEIVGASEESENTWYLFKVPNNMKLKINYDHPFTRDKIEVKDFNKKIEISSLNHELVLSNVSGPLLLTAVNGGIKVDFKNLNQNTESKIVAVNNNLEIHLPDDTPANLIMESKNGRIYTNFDIDFNEKGKDDLRFIGGAEHIYKELNNGGSKLRLEAVNGNIYLRSK